MPSYCSLQSISNEKLEFSKYLFNVFSLVPTLSFIFRNRQSYSSKDAEVHFPVGRGALEDRPPRVALQNLISSCPSAWNFPAVHSPAPHTQLLSAPLRMCIYPHVHLRLHHICAHSPSSGTSWLATLRLGRFPSLSIPVLYSFLWFLASPHIVTQCRVLEAPWFLSEHSQPLLTSFVH